MNNKLKILLSIACFVVAAILVAVSFLPFVRIVGEWERELDVDSAKYSLIYEFDFSGNAKMSGVIKYENGETKETDSEIFEYEVEGDVIKVEQDDESEESNEFKVNDSSLTIYGEDKEFNMKFDRKGFAPLWIFRIAAAVVAVLGVVLLLIKSKGGKPSGYGYSATAIPESPYDFAPAGGYGYTAPTDYAGGAVTPEAPAYTPETSTYTPEAPAYTPEAPAYTPETPAYTPETPAYTPETPAYTPETPAYTPETPAYTPEAPAYTPETPAYTPETPVYTPETPAYAPSYDYPTTNLPKSKPTTDSDRFSPAGDL